MRVFIDFQNKVPHRVYLPDEDKVYRVRDENLIDFLEITGVNEVYIESAPRGWIYRLLENNITVYILRYKNQSKLRKQYGLRKNHSNDARLLHLIYKKIQNTLESILRDNWITTKIYRSIFSS